MGNGDNDYLIELNRIVYQYDVNSRIIFHKAVSIDKLWKYVGASDLGIIIPKIVAKSYYFGLGNKFFENIQSMVPIVCNNTPEMAKIINKYNIGITIDPPNNVDKTSEAITKLQTNRNLYNLYKTNIFKAKENLCWENEREILIDAYMKLFR